MKTILFFGITLLLILLLWIEDDVYQKEQVVPKICLDTIVISNPKDEVVFINKDFHLLIKMTGMELNGILYLAPENKKMEYCLHSITFTYGCVMFKSEAYKDYYKGITMISFYKEDHNVYVNLFNPKILEEHYEQR